MIIIIIIIIKIIIIIVVIFISVVSKNINFWLQTFLNEDAVLI